MGAGVWLMFAAIVLAQSPDIVGSRPDAQREQDAELTHTSDVGVPPAPGMGDDVCWPGVGDPGYPCTTNDECSVVGRCGTKDAYISFTPPAASDLAIRITIVAMPQFPDRAGDVWWVKAPKSVSDAPHAPISVAEVECTNTPHKQD